MSERRYSPLATLFAATFLFRIGNAVAALALPWFVLSHTKSAAWAGATAASSVIATIIGAWVGGGLVDRFGRAPVALISGVVGGVAMASIPLLDAVGALSNTGLIACVVLGAAFDAPGMAAQDSELPKLGHVAGLSVERVSSLKAVIGNVAILGGPALGGAAIGLLGAAPTLRQTHRKIRAASADGAYDTRLCHDELRRKKISALIPPRKGAGYWPGEYADRNRAVANQRMTGSNARWKWTTDYNRRSIAETAMYRVKQLFGGSLTLRDYDGQVAEAMALVRALNKMTKAGMPESVRIA
ncbi:transposase [Klebsiella pneumoniae]|uniref:transposase n=1 Tax=Klebsiella pneumoniae TaxID=573 RepID=UPI000E2AC691|nr:transposase [Klebsiella pneumoniae]SXT60748.1 Mrx [Klebsiella pneumoniae]